MKCLSLIKNNLELKDELFEEIKDDLENIENVLEKHNINFEENFAISFWNHAISFIQRAKKNEFVDDLDEDMVKEISKEAIEIAREIFSKVFQKYERDEKLSEIYLVSIHIQVAKGNM